MKKPNTVVLIHGLWMTPRCWDPFAQYFQRIGYKVHRPAWPRLHGEPENMRKSPEALAGLGVLEIADHYEKFVRSLPEPPILIGHSFGGLIVEILLARGLGVAGVAIDATAPKGIYRLPFAQLRAASPVLSNPLNYRRTVMLTLDQFRYAFANTMSEAAARQAYDRDAIPGPGRPLFQAAFANFLPNAATKVDYRNGKRAPLLLIGGAQDHTVPASVCRSAFRKYRSARAVTEYKEFPDRCHLLITQDGWEEVADYAITWATTNFQHWNPQAVVAA